MDVRVNSVAAAWIHTFKKSCDLKNVKKNPETVQSATVLL